jgi:ABC-type transport system involved in multi-copper enzyme maturation permease subunit
MTVYARGYRPFTGEVRPRRLRFLTIFQQGYADARRGVGFRIFQIVILVIFVVIAILLNLQAGPFGRGLASMARQAGLAPTDEELARMGLASGLFYFHSIAILPTALLALFVGAGLVADDLRTRALPLYLVRPVTPLDYFLGKWLVTFVVLAVHVLLPSLLILLMAALLRPSGQSTAFLAAQGDIVGTILAHFAVVSITYTSVVLLVSTMAQRRGTAIVAGALVFIGGGVVAGIFEEVGGTLGEVGSALTPMGNGFRVLADGIGALVPDLARSRLPEGTTPVFVAAAVALAACAFVVIRRARTTEVVS